MSLKGYESSYYVSTANKKTEYPQLVGEKESDICVIGAGYTGLSVALHLAEKGYSVSLLESEKVGWGASGRNGGQVCQDHNMSHEELTKKVGRSAADSLWEMSVESVDLVKDLIKKHNIACDLKSGVMSVSVKPAYAKDMMEDVAYINKDLNYDAVHFVDKNEVENMLGSDKYYSGKYWTDAAHLHPLNYALGLANAAQEAGVNIFENSKVTSYQTGKNAEVKTSKGLIKAKYILLACNGYLGKLESRVAGKIMPINNFILATEPLSEELCRKINRDDIAIADSKFVVNYFRMSADNRLLWGGGENYSSKFPKDIRGFVQKYMLEFYPELKDVKIDYGWGGTLAITLNRMPHFERIEENLFVAQGYSGHGVALATLGGKLMAEA
ncbi:MAG: gamma-glutamylputrescine oxidase, partial [Cocleimonas sp.]